MENLFFHPKLVHVPMALALVVPVIALVVLFAWWRGTFPKATWGIVVLLQVMLVGGAIASMRSGEAEEEKVEDIVGEHNLEEHEEAAKAFTGASVAVALVMLGAAFLRTPRSSQAVAALAVLGSLAVLGLGIRAGQRGGALVYQHGAAKAYQQNGNAPEQELEHEHDND